MTRLALLGPARDVAGVSEDDVPGTTVGEVLDGAVLRYGDDFARLLARSQVWLNTEPASRETPVTSHDVVSVLPPVSGG